MNGVRHDAAARDARAPLPSAVLTPGARFGIVAGTCGWAFALAAVAAACDARLFLRVGVPAAAGSLVAARAVLRLVERRLRAGLDERARFKTVFGLALVLVAVVGSVLTAWILPELLRNACARAILRATGSITDVPWPVLAACGVGGVLLWIAGRRR